MNAYFVMICKRFCEALGEYLCFNNNSVCQKKLNAFLKVKFLILLLIATAFEKL